MASLKEIIEYSKANPDTDYAKRSYELIQKGSFDEQSQQEGVDLSWAGRPPLKQGFIQSVGKSFNDRFTGDVKQKNPLQTGADIAYGVGGFINDTVGAGVSAITPNFVKDGLKTALTQALGVKITDKKKVSDLVATAMQKYEEIKKNHPDAIHNLEGITGLLSAATAVVPVAKLGVGVAETSLKGGLSIARKTPSLVKSGVEAGMEKVKNLPQTFSDIKQGVKTAVTGVAPKVGDELTDETALSIVREVITPDYKERAALEKRMYTEGNLGEIKYKPSPREQKLSDSIRPLVERGELPADKLPFEHIPVISQEVARINQGVEQMLFERKIPFNGNQLRSRLNSVKEDSKIIFTTDPTLERTYDSLVDAFMAEVSTKDTLGLFQARQGFDKLPAVKKLLDGIKGSQGENLRRQAVLDIRRAANEYVSDLLPPNNPYRELLKQESYMIEVVGNLAEKSKNLGGTNVARFFADNPGAKAITTKVIPSFVLGGLVF